MAQKKKSNKKGAGKQASPRSKLLLIIAIALVAVLAWKYRNDDDFRHTVDETIAAVSDRAEETAEVVREKTGESTPGGGESTQAETEGGKASKTQSKTDAKKSDSSTKSAGGYISLPDGLEIPLCAGQKNGKDHQIRAFEHYTICYRETYEQAEWSAYRLDVSQLVKGSDRTNDFRPDPEIKTESATLADYRGSGYDRGHLTPAADMSFSKTAMSETFYMSNMSPQAGAFNRGIWQQLESRVRDWARAFGRVYVVSGPVLDKPASKYETIGKSKVAIPQYYYKVILAPLYADANDRKSPDDAKAVAAIGFILPNDGCDGKTFMDFCVSVDEVERRTGLDFYSLLDDDAENAAEAKFDKSLWEN